MPLLKKTIIKKLKADHVKLISSFETIVEKVNDKKIVDFDLVLSFIELNKILTPHLKLEDYVYSVFKYSENKKERQFVKNLSKEMQEISKLVLNFFEYYHYEEISTLRKNSKFKKDLKFMIKQVKKRIHLEETKLFPLYSKFKH